MLQHKRQRGFMNFTTLFTLVTAIVMGLLAIRLTPVYTEYFSVVKSVKSLQQFADDNQQQMSTDPRVELKRSLLKRLYINQITHIKDKNIKVEKKGKGYEVKVTYETQVKLFSNIDAVIKFNPSAMVIRRAN